MERNEYDALVIGGGPGGSTAASFLARAGRRILLLEKERFPRFHIGESLLPYNRVIFDELGVWPALQAAGFTVKHGAQFHLSNASKSLSLVFRNGRFTRQPSALQVERATFDEILLKHARSSGADVREGWTVTHATADADRASVEARSPEGATHRFTGAFLIDASGRSNLTGSQQGLREDHPKLKKLALFGHFKGVTLDPGEKGGDTVIVRFENKWFWLIPLSPGKVSVGCVLDQSEFLKAQEPPHALFEQWCESSPLLRERMRGAVLLGPMRTTSDFSYHNRRLVGPRLARVGDAAGFMDPIFSAGVFLAMHSGKLAARLVEDSLTSGDGAERRLADYEKRVFRAMRLYWELVEGFYTSPFMEVFLEPRHRFDLPAAVTAILAGELEGSWTLRWRLRMFFALVQLQAWWPILPRLNFQPGAPAQEESRIGQCDSSSSSESRS